MKHGYYIAPNFLEQLLIFGAQIALASIERTSLRDLFSWLLANICHSFKEVLKVRYPRMNTDIITSSTEAFWSIFNLTQILENCNPRLVPN